jgi:GNAT superfamily N-acetyltransferase
MNGELEIRRVDAGEWRDLRALRLRALRGAPLAFGSTLERESAYDQTRWRGQAQSAAAGEDNVAIVAVADGRLIGMACGYLGPSEELEPQTVVWLIGVYVDPAWRGRGVARDLSAEVVGWARERGVAEVHLHVADWNAAAQRTYEALGFEASGATTTLSHDPSITEAEMRLRL